MSFTLEIQLHADALDAMKGYLTRALPDVKSSHRCEALARGFAFRTYAAMKAAASDLSADGTLRATGEHFTDYLREQGFEVAPVAFYRAAALAALLSVHAREPLLTVWGMGVGELRRHDDGRWETYDERMTRVAEARAELVADSSTEAFLLALALVQRLTPTTTVRPGSGSYKLKHIAENYLCDYPGGGRLGPRYVSNGLLIAAAVHAGYRHSGSLNRNGFHDINVNFNMSKRAVVDLDCEVRPDGAAAQDRRAREAWRRTPSYYRAAY